MIVKICGVKTFETAIHALEAGADMLGFNFYPPSPRHVSVAVAGEIAAALPAAVAKVGVFVDETFDNIMRTDRSVRLNAIQLHGTESPQLMEKRFH